MRDVKSIVVLVICSTILGCDFSPLKNPPITITFRQGVLSKYVMQVNNLSTSEGVEVYVYVANESISTRSGNVVVPANSAKEFGALEINWDFKAGDKGFVCPVKYGKKLFFAFDESGKFKKWFGYDDIPEVDVARHVKYRRVEDMKREAAAIFSAIAASSKERTEHGSGDVWPKTPPSLKEKAKAKFSEWRGRIAAKIADGDAPNVPQGDRQNDRYFSNSADYFADASSRIASMPQLQYAWSIVADYDETMSCQIPVIVSANVPCERLLSFWDGKERNDSSAMPLNAAEGVVAGVAVIVYGNGRVVSLDAGEMLPEYIYEPFNTLTNGVNRPIRYLTPQGVKSAREP